MRSDLRSLRERIRQLEAGGHRDTPLRRAYNHKLRAHRSLRGGGGLPNEEEFNALNDKVSTLNEKVSTLDEKVNTLKDQDHLDEKVSTLKTQVESLRGLFLTLYELPDKFNILVDKVESLEDTVKAKTTKSDSTASKHEGKKAGSPKIKLKHTTVRGFEEHVERLKTKTKQKG